MDTNPRRHLAIEPLPAASSEIGRWLWALDDTRRRTLRTLAGINPAALDWSPGSTNTIGALLYHIAVIEMDWLFVEVLEQPFPQHVADLFPYGVRDDHGQLAAVRGIGIEEYRRLLAATRVHLVEVFESMPLQAFRRACSLPDYDVTPEWVLHHLIQHEAEHRAEIAGIQAAWEREFGTHADRMAPGSAG